MLYKYLILLFCFMVGHACAMDYTSSNTYRGVEISPTTLLELLKQEAELSAEDEQEIREFIEQYNLAPVLSGAEYQEVMFTGCQEERKALMDRLAAYLEEKQVPVIPSLHTIIINIHNKWVIKRSKLYIARQNAVDTLESITQGARKAGEFGRVLTQKEWHLFETLLGGRTYQNISRAMVYLRAREAARLLREELSENISGLIPQVPDTYLLPIEGRPESIDDRNYFLIERFIPGQFVPVHETPYAVDQDFVLIMVRMIAYTGWWNLEGNVNVVGDQIYNTDQELPNRHDSRHVLHRDVAHFRDLVRAHGWKQLEEKIIHLYAQAHTLPVEELLARKHALEEQIMRVWATTQPVYPASNVALISPEQSKLLFDRITQIALSMLNSSFLFFCFLLRTYQKKQ